MRSEFHDLQWLNQSCFFDGSEVQVFEDLIQHFVGQLIHFNNKTLFFC